MRILLVDDERLARVGLRQLLSAHPDVTIIGEAANVEEARKACEAFEPDLLLLDIEMPGENGFALLEMLEHPPNVIFTTAYPSHAVRAFEVEAVDYLLKPVKADRLAEALERVRGRRPATMVETNGPPERPKPLERAFVREGERGYLIPFAEVSLLESEGNFTRVHLAAEQAQPFLARSLNYLEERLDPAKFFRANRRQLVNLDFVARIESEGGQALVLTLRTGKEVAVSRRQSLLFRQRLKA